MCLFGDRGGERKGNAENQTSAPVYIAWVSILLVGHVLSLNNLLKIYFSYITKLVCSSSTARFFLYDIISNW